MLNAGLTLQALLEHQDAGDLTLLTGTERSWATVAVDVTEQDLPESVTDGLAVLTTPAPAVSWQADALIRRIRDRGFTGIALTGHPIGAGTRALAERLGVLVLHVEHPTRLARACWQLLEARDALTLSTVQKIARSIEYQAHDLGDLLNHVAANVGQGIALVDREGVLQSAGNPVPTAVLERIDFDHWLDIAETSEGFAASVPVESRSRHGLRIVLHGKNAGVAHRNALAAAVEVLMPIVAARLLVDEVESVSDVSRSSGLLGDFLETRGNLNPEVEQRMLARGWRVSGYHLGFRMVGRGRVDPLELLRFLTSKLALLPVDSHATTRGAGVTGWLTVPHAPTPAQVAHHVRERDACTPQPCPPFPSPPASARWVREAKGWPRPSVRLATRRGWPRTAHEPAGSSRSTASVWSSCCFHGRAATRSLPPLSPCSARLSETDRHTLVRLPGRGVVGPLDSASPGPAPQHRLGPHPANPSRSRRRSQRSRDPVGSSAGRVESRADTPPGG